MKAIAVTIFASVRLRQGRPAAQGCVCSGKSTNVRMRRSVYDLVPCSDVGAFQESSSLNGGKHRRHAAICRGSLPSAPIWYVRESRYVWVAGVRSHCILQTEGGEQGDPLMPAMFSVALQPALGAEHLLRHAQLHLQTFKTKAWNCAGMLPCGVPALPPDSPIWVSDLVFPPILHGLVALGVPVGTPEFIEAHLRAVLARQASLLDTLPALQDSLVAWLLLSYCAAPCGPTGAVCDSQLAATQHTSVCCRP